MLTFQIKFEGMVYGRSNYDPVCTPYYCIDDQPEEKGLVMSTDRFIQTSWSAI